MELQMTIQTKQYQIIRNLVSREVCDVLTDKLWALKKLNYFVFDNQCPISYSFYGILDPLLTKYREALSKEINIDLRPTYSYTRIYRVGEELAVHTDRESCEYSVTLCLGMSDETNPWPIYMGDEKVILAVGDACIYKGCDIPHRREMFEEEWQAQTFMHYVDSNGPYKDYELDGRDRLGEQESEPIPVAPKIENYKEKIDDGFFQDIT
jgi:hypothetical protein